VLAPRQAGQAGKFRFLELAFWLKCLYNEAMLVSAEVMRVCLLLCLLGMAALAAFYLRERRMPLWEYVGWGLVIVLLPLVGPFVVLLARPGQPLRRKRHPLSVC